MARINQRIERPISKPRSTKEDAKKVKKKAKPPKSIQEANAILDALYERNPILSLTCHMSALTGLRYSDASWLKYSDFYDGNKFRSEMEVTQQKSYRMRSARIQKTYNELLEKAVGKEEIKRLEEERDKSENEAYRKSTITVYTNAEIEKIVEETRFFSNGSQYLFANPRSRIKQADGTIIDRPMSVESADWHHAKIKEQLTFIDYSFGTHSWRKLFAKMLMDKNTGVEKIRDLLGHSSLMITNAYLETFSEDLKEATQNLSLVT